MNSKPLVSIITVVYNGGKHLEQTIQSVLNQSYSNIEYIIIDGGSTDDTLNIIRKYEKNVSKWISEPDKGLYDAMNKGIKMTHGELIGMINSDDWYEENAIELMTKAYLAHPDRNIFHADRFNVLEDGTKILYKHNPSEKKFIYHGMTYNHPSMFVTSREYLRHTYNDELTVLSDYLFVLESFLYDKGKFYYLPQPIVNYRLDGLSAQMGFFAALKEGFKAREIAGLSFFKNSISLLVRFALSLLFRLRRKIRIETLFIAI